MLNSKSEKQLKMFLLLHHFLSRSLESYIKETSKALGIKMVIDQSLIHEDEDIAEEEDDISLNEVG